MAKLHDYFSAWNAGKSPPLLQAEADYRERLREAHERQLNVEIAAK